MLIILYIFPPDELSSVRTVLFWYLEQEQTSAAIFRAGCIIPDRPRVQPGSPLDSQLLKRATGSCGWEGPHIASSWVQLCLFLDQQVILIVTHVLVVYRLLRCILYGAGLEDYLEASTDTEHSGVDMHMHS